MKMILGAAVVGCALAAACASGGTTVSSSGGDIASATPVNGRSLPAGTVVEATLNDAIGTKRSHVGDQFSVTVAQPVVAQNGVTVVPAGATINGHVTGLHSPNVIGQQAAIRLDFDNMIIDGRQYAFDAEISGVKVKNDVNESSVTKGAATGAAAGAVLGAVLGGVDLGSILKGSLLGAATGTVISLGTGGLEATIPAGSAMMLRSTSAVSLR